MSPPLGFEEQQVINDARLTRRRRTITFADLVSGVANGASVDIPLGLVLAGLAGQQQPMHRLPAGALLVNAPVIKLDTQFTGGGVSAVGVTLGTAGSPTVVATSFDVRGSAVGPYVDMTRGIWRIVPADSLIVARFTPDGGHNLSQLTAGSCTIDFVFVPKASA
jgi:hypothetical protein